MLSQQPNLTVIGRVAETDEIVSEVPTLAPDVILLDLCVPGREGLEGAKRIRAVYAGARILMMGLACIESDVLACIEAGAAGCVSREASVEDLLNNIQAAVSGEVLCSPRVAGLLCSSIAEAHRKGKLRQLLGLPNLTRREREVTALIADGLSNKEIATRLRIEVQTVKNHIHNILDKLKLNGRREAAAYAKQHGLLNLSERR
jgi:DNA-binding NarL/FixJ family response regulator